MKDVKLKLISELMKNSRRSDRDLAKAIGTSQPTVTRLRNELEKEGIIKEYTALPDFSRLGYEILALTFTKLKKGVNQAEAEKAKKIVEQKLRENGLEVIMLEMGMGMKYDAVVISLHEDYSCFEKFIRQLNDHIQFMDLNGCEHFLINLKSENRFKFLTFSTLAQHLSSLKDKKKE